MKMFVMTLGCKALQSHLCITQTRNIQKVVQMGEEYLQPAIIEGAMCSCEEAENKRSEDEDLGAADEETQTKNYARLIEALTKLKTEADAANSFSSLVTRALTILSGTQCRDRHRLIPTV